MKDYIRLVAFATAIVLIMSGLSACNDSNSNLSSTERTAVQASTIATTLMTAMTTAEPELNPLDFDPYSAEGWYIYGGDGWRDSAIWLTWMKEKEMLIAKSDCSFGDFYLSMPLEDAAQHFPSVPLSEKVENYAVVAEKTLTFDSLVLMFVSVNDDESEGYTLFAIETSSSEYVTPRGLRVGDDAEKVFVLYGLPMWVLNNEWTYGKDENYSRFRVTVENGVVQKIFLFSD